MVYICNTNVRNARWDFIQTGSIYDLTTNVVLGCQRLNDIKIIEIPAWSPGWGNKDIDRSSSALVKEKRREERKDDQSNWIGFLPTNKQQCNI